MNVKYNQLSVTNTQTAIILLVVIRVPVSKDIEEMENLLV